MRAEDLLTLNYNQSEKQIALVFAIATNKNTIYDICSIDNLIVVMDEKEWE